MFLTKSADVTQKEAQNLADHLQIKWCEDTEEFRDTKELHLHLSKEGLALRQGDISMMGDFTYLIPRLKQSNLEREMLIKATKPKNLGANPRLLDATAGMGEDSLILAAAGFQVTLYEYDPIIAALLEDTVERSFKIPELTHVAERMKVIQGDSIAAMKNMEKESFDIILLDPMFPARNKSGLIKKKFQLLQQLESPCSNEEDLIQAAILACPKKIVVKRPAKGPFLGGVKPDYSLNGKAIRYDCLINVNRLSVGVKAPTDNRFMSK